MVGDTGPVLFFTHEQPIVLVPFNEKPAFSTELH